MSIVCRCFFVMFLAFSPLFAYAASVPLILPTASPPDTCEEDVWDIIKARADMEANREIVQNQNLISKPDSVLMLTCFDRQMGHLGNYADDHFPSHPDESLGNTVSIGGIFTEIMVILIRELLGDVDPYLTGGRLPPPLPSLSFVKGGQLIHLLEILVLDNLVDGVSSIANAYDDILLLHPACPTGKEFYIDDNMFDGVLMGGRSGSYIQMPDGLSKSNFNGCPEMNNIWNEARCMSFQMDTGGAMRNSDRFHTLQGYVDNEIAGNDYRQYPNMCTWGADDLGVTELACHVWEHGIPPLPTGFADIISFALNMTASGHTPWTHESAAPTYWQDLDTQSAVVPGGPGGTDPYLHRLEMFRSATAAECSAIQPVRNGLIAKDLAGNEYYDAVCPAAGCWFDPPTSLGATGSCNR